MSVGAMAVRWPPACGDAVHTALSQFPDHAVSVITEGASHTDPLQATGIANISAHLLYLGIWKPVCPSSVQAHHSTGAENDVPSV